MRRELVARFVAVLAAGLPLIATTELQSETRPTIGIWISQQELAALPVSGPAWANLKAAADRPLGTPDLSNQDDNVDVHLLAKALVFARMGGSSYRNDVIAACDAAIGTEAGGRTLALGRNLLPYILAADLVVLPADVDARFSAWLNTCLTETLDGKTLISTHNQRPNNWGTHAGASRMAAARYLRDNAELARAATVFKGWLGDRAAYAGFEFGDLSWQADPGKPVAINPKGAMKQGHNIDGILPDDQRRGGGFTWPPPHENYVYEALQGAIAQAVILKRAGYDAFNWQDQALRRAFQWLHGVCGFASTGDDTWEPHIINCCYGTSFPAPVPSNPGKNVGWADWTHAPVAMTPPPPSPPPSLSLPPSPPPTPAPPPADPPTPPPAVTIGPSDDTHVQSGSVNGGYGSLTVMRVRAGDPAYKMYLKFKIVGLAGPVASAKLRLFVTDESDKGGSLFCVDNRYVNSTTPWTQAGLTWTNAPAPGLAVATLGRVSAEKWVEFDVASVITGDGTFSFMMNTTSSNSAYYCTKEGSHPPQLVITFASEAVTLAN